jgi:hypothetical protein
MDRTTPTAQNEEIELYIRTYYSLLRSSGPVRVRSNMTTLRMMEAVPPICFHMVMLSWYWNEASFGRGFTGKISAILHSISFDLRSFRIGIGMPGYARSKIMGA